MKSIEIRTMAINPLNNTIVVGICKLLNKDMFHANLSAIVNSIIYANIHIKPGLKGIRYDVFNNVLTFPDTYVLDYHDYKIWLCQHSYIQDEIDAFVKCEEYYKKMAEDIVNACMIRSMGITHNCN